MADESRGEPRAKRVGGDLDEEATSLAFGVEVGWHPFLQENLFPFSLPFFRFCVVEHLFFFSSLVNFLVK